MEWNYEQESNRKAACRGGADDLVAENQAKLCIPRPETKKLRALAFPLDYTRRVVPRVQG